MVVVVAAATTVVVIRVIDAPIIHLGPRSAFSPQLLHDMDERAGVHAHLAKLHEDRERVLVEPRIQQPRDLVQD